jgi:hypothetical protein
MHPRHALLYATLSSIVWGFARMSGEVCREYRLRPCGPRVVLHVPCIQCKKTSLVSASVTGGGRVATAAGAAAAAGRLWRRARRPGRRRRRGAAGRGCAPGRAPAGFAGALRAYVVLHRLCGGLHHCWRCGRRPDLAMPHSARAMTVAPCPGSPSTECARVHAHSVTHTCVCGGVARTRRCGWWLGSPTCSPQTWPPSPRASWT